MNTAERIYLVLLRAYPRRFRARYERELLLAFRDQRRGMSSGGMRFWGAIMLDLIASAAELWLEDLQSDGKSDTELRGMKMKAMAILALLFGVLEVANALAEGFAGGMANRPPLATLTLAMTMVGGALLILSGIAILRGSRLTTAIRISLLCLALFAAAVLVEPILSIAAFTIGIAFPVVLVVSLYFQKSGGQAALP